MNSANASIDEDRQSALRLASGPLKKRVVTTSDYGGRRGKVRRSLGVICRLGDPQFNQALGEQELAGNLATGNSLGPHQLVNRAVADAKIIRNLCNGHEVRDRVHTGKGFIRRPSAPS